MTATMYPIFLILLTWFSITRQGLTAVPNPSCEHEGENNGAYYDKKLVCTEANLDIPGNFDVTRFPASLYSIHLSCPDLQPGSDTYCNTIRDNCQPIPFNSTTFGIINLFGFRATDLTRRPPIDTLFHNVKHDVTELNIYFSRLNYLDRNFFLGFVKLSKLILQDCGIKTIAPDTFAGLASPIPDVTPADVDNPDRKPALEKIDLSENAIEQLDWAALQPLAKSLKDLQMCCQNPGLKTLSKSGPAFYLSKLWSLDLTRNALPTIPTDVLKTLTPQKSQTYYRFFENNFCAQTDCSCCPLKDFILWLTSIPKLDKAHRQAPREDYRMVNLAQLDRIHFQCGGQDRTEASSFALEAFNNCPA